jgi:multidrug efflux pump subunit AcrA (membrane-fusion protein)
MQSGELQIVKLAKNGAMVTPGDLLVQFDGSTLQRTIQEKQSELRQSDAEIEQARAQSRLTEEQNATRADEGALRHRSRKGWTSIAATRSRASRTTRRS